MYRKNFNLKIYLEHHGSHGQHNISTKNFMWFFSTKKCELFD